MPEDVMHDCLARNDTTHTGMMQHVFYVNLTRQHTKNWECLPFAKRMVGMMISVFPTTA